MASMFRWLRVFMNHVPLWDCAGKGTSTSDKIACAVEQPVYVVSPTPSLFAPIVLELKAYLDTHHANSLQAAVAAACASRARDLLLTRGIKCEETFLLYVNVLLRWIPIEDHDGKAIYEDLCIFYFVLGQPVLQDLQIQLQPENCTKPLPWLSGWIVRFAQQVGTFHDTPESISPEVIESFVKVPRFRMDECIVPEGGFKSFNELFARHIRPATRPIASPSNAAIVIYPADCTFKMAAPIDDEAIVTLKGLPWKITDLVKDTGLASAFAGGIWMHGFLNTHDYHRQHAPVAGRVVEAKVVPGAAFFSVKEITEHDGNVRIGPNSHGISCPLQCDDSPGHQFIQTRGVIVIDSPVLGLVAILPIGMAQVSSVRLSVAKGDVVEKGQEIAYFQFGGSDCVMMFTRQAGLDINDFPTEPVHHLMGEEMIRVKTMGI